MQVSVENRQRRFISVLNTKTWEELRLYLGKGPDEIDLHLSGMTLEKWGDTVSAVLLAKMGEPGALVKACPAEVSAFTRDTLKTMTEECKVMRSMIKNLSTALDHWESKARRLVETL